MGRRKIEIKAIKDDRNRSVTFLKRKGGLFKKAHELAVLCSVDVTVIIFGHNKKLYEFSSGDIRETLGRYQYYGQPHEHKGPADFAGKKEEEDTEGATPAPDDGRRRSQTHSIPPTVPPQQAFQHVNDTPAPSPPISNGAQYHPRNGTPQPTVISRPSSRNNVQRVHPSVMPQQPHHHSTPPPQAAQNGYGYMQHPNIYNTQVNPNMAQQPMRQPQYPYSRPPTSQPQVSQAPMTQHPPHHSMPMHHQHPHQYHQQPHLHPHQSHHVPHHPPPQHQPYSHAAQHINNQDNHRRQSMPPAFPQQERQMPHPEQTSQSEHLRVKTEHNNSPPGGIKPLPATKSRSVYTPIDDHRSVLAQLAFGPPPDKIEPKDEESQTPTETKKILPPAPAPPPPVKPMRSLPEPHRTQSMSSIHSLQSGPKQRGPRLTVQIPSENSDAGSGTAGSSPKDGSKNTSLTPAKEGGHSAVVLPPPSPSASALLSAGASGPPNPFARPPPPGTTAPGNVDTPMSALPSRFVSDTLLPSPSLFYSEWGFGRSGPDSNMLPSPLTFPTPVVPTAPGFSRETDDPDKKRKSPDSGANDNSAPKRLKAD